MSGFEVVYLLTARSGGVVCGGCVSGFRDKLPGTQPMVSAAMPVRQDFRVRHQFSEKKAQSGCLETQPE